MRRQRKIYFNLCLRMRNWKIHRGELPARIRPLVHQVQLLPSAMAKAMTLQEKAAHMLPTMHKGRSRWKGWGGAEVWSGSLGHLAAMRICRNNIVYLHRADKWAEIIINMCE